MNPLLKKEIRLVLPAWIGALMIVLLASFLAPMWFSSASSGLGPLNPDLVPVLFGMAMLFPAIASFGQEFSFKTFSLALSQPVDRRRLWRFKITLLFAASLSVALVLFAAYEIGLHWRPVYDIAFPWTPTAIVGLVVLSGGLWSALLFRQIVAAFWMTLITPCCLLIPIGDLSNHYHWPVQVGAAFLVCYSVAGFFLAHHLFIHAQDIERTGGNFLFPWRKKAAEQSTSFIFGPFRNRFVVLIWKEIQLHEANLFIAAILLVLTLGAVLGRVIVSSPVWKMYFDMAPGVWVLMPLLIGCAAVAEERVLGTLQSQLCLPVSRRAQLCAKFFTALVLGVILGGLVPWLIGTSGHFPPYAHHHILPFVVAAAIFFTSFYASSLARSTIQAMGIAISFSTILWLAAITPPRFLFLIFSKIDPLTWMGWWILFIRIGLPILLLVLAALMIWNFKWVHTNWKLLRRNAAAIMAALAGSCVLTNAIYFRTWEFFMPSEAHGLPKISHASEVKFAYGLGAIYAVLPDGRLWTETLQSRPVNERFFVSQIFGEGRSQFIDGSNWVAVAASSGLQALGIRSNGTLWSIQIVLPLRPLNQPLKFRLTQIGSDTNWSQIAGSGYGFLCLKRDGALYEWGTSIPGRTGQSVIAKLRSDRETAPRLVTHGNSGSAQNESPADLNGSVWTNVCRDGNAAAGVRDDGEIWILTREWDAGRWTNRVAFERRSVPAIPGETQTFMPGWRRFVSWFWGLAGVKNNGQLWIRWQPTGVDSRTGKPQAVEEAPIRIGGTARWKDVAYAQFNSVLAIRSDGSLWEWPIIWRSIRQPHSAIGTRQQPSWDQPYVAKPFKLSKHSDWLAFVASAQSQIYPIILAADGGLWAWEPSSRVWMAPSRRPTYLGNVFEAGGK
ncbi:MAG: hypothetical protein KGR98_03385 [Verrucomicrobia bacterium]|nr:hypothetical protein [Verrucomicrobiota bacterium]